MSKPDFIIAAEHALQKCKDHQEYALLQKRLPGLAARLHQAGETVNEDILTEAAEKGVAHIEALIKTLSTPPSQPTYDSVVKALKPATDKKHPDEDIEEESEPSPTDNANKRLMYYAALGQKSGVISAIEQGADIHINNDRVLLMAAYSGDVPTLEVILEHKPDINTVYSSGSQKCTALFYAAANDHHDAIRLLLKHKADINNGTSAAIFAAINGRLDTLELLYEHGADIHAENERVLLCAVECKQDAVIEWLLEKQVDIHAQDEEALICAIDRGFVSTARLLLENGADATARNNFGLILAAQNGDKEMVDLLIEHGAHIRPDCTDVGLRLIMNTINFDFLVDQMVHNEDFFERMTKISQKLEDWSAIAGVQPPPICETLSPHFFKDKNVQKTYTDIACILYKEEGLGFCESAYRGFEISALFGTTQRVLQYLEKWGEAGDKPLFNACHMIKLPADFSPETDLKAWGDACIQHGPKMAEMFCFADKYPSPRRSADKTNWLYTETMNDIARLAYQNAGEDIKLAQLFYKHRMPEKKFNRALQLTKKIKIKSDIPDISFTLPNGMRYRKLADQDYRGLILGKLTSCCQSIGLAGDNGDACTRHGYQSSQGGFYVVEDKKGEIIGQSWAWLGPDNTLMLDSLENKIDRIDDKTWTSLIREFAKQIDRKAPEIGAVHIGRGGETPVLPFKKAAGVKLKGYLGYHDSKGLQYQPYKRRSKGITPS